MDSQGQINTGGPNGDPWRPSWLAGVLASHEHRTSKKSGAVNSLAAGEIRGHSAFAAWPRGIGAAILRGNATA